MLPNHNNNSFITSLLTKCHLVIGKLFGFKPGKQAINDGKLMDLGLKFWFIGCFKFSFHLFSFHFS